MNNYNERLDEIFKKSPIDNEVPEDIWETIYATSTGLWTDGYGEWDEKQPSDIYPLDELLSTQARDRLKQAITSLIKELVAEAKPKIDLLDIGVLTGGTIALDKLGRKNIHAPKDEKKFADSSTIEAHQAAYMVAYKLKYSDCEDCSKNLFVCTCMVELEGFTA